MNKVRYQGFFTPVNKKKYIGDSEKIVFRSLWEKQVMEYLDKNSNVISWGSEEFSINYLSPIDNKIHRYFPDFIAKIRTKNEEEKIVVMEVKPLKQTMLPESKKATKNAIRDTMIFAVNDAKFKAAKLFCEEKGWEFQVITEHDLKITR